MRDATLLETQNASLSIIIGVTFIANSVSADNIFTRYGAPFKWLGAVPLWILGSVFVFAGAVHLLTLYTGRHWLRKQIVLIKAGLWLFLGVAVLQVEPLAPSAWCYVVFAFSAMFAFWRIKLKKDGTTHSYDSI